MASQGSVVTRVYTSDAYLPLRNVAVIYRQTTQEGTNTLLAVKNTNISGLTEPLYIETPDLEQSLTPGSMLKPYTTISITVSAPGYNTATAEGVQIFPGVQTLQGFQLRPLSSFDLAGSTIVKEPPQNL